MVNKAKGGRHKGASRRTGNAWHQGFAHVVSQRQPPGFDTRSEVGLTQQPGRVDLVIERRPGQLPRHDDARIMRGLWPRLSRITLLEFKGPLQMGNMTAQSAGYQDFRSHLQSDHAELLTNESWSEIEEIAKEWLEDKYRNEWGTSNTGENYYEYWGNYWDRNHGG